MSNKKQNAFAAYFKPFGLRQICDILMLIAAVLIIVSICLNETGLLIMTIGLALFIAAAALSVIRAIVFLVSEKAHKRSPEFKKALTIIIFMSIGIILAAVCLYLNYSL